MFIADYCSIKMTFHVRKMTVHDFSIVFYCILLYFNINKGTTLKHVKDSAKNK